jgi:hypothetical protein
VPRLAVVLVVLGGIVWVFSAIAYSAVVVGCFSCGSAVVAAGIDTSDYSAGAINTLAWDALYANLYIATIGLLAVLIGLTAFRRGHRWAWLAMAVFALAGLLTAILDELAWGGWFTYLFLGVLPALGVLMAAPSVLWHRRKPTNPVETDTPPRATESASHPIP